MQKYIAVKVVQAEPESRDGKEGFKVVYEEGYESWCPRDVFLKHNRTTDAIPFSHALEAVRAGKKIARKGWNAQNLWVYLAVPDEHSLITRPYLYIEYPVGHPAYLRGSRVPWFASATDVLADDWFIVE
jgi:hypothetical protein